ncbi:hypothetical protein GGX14DRAFT_553283 [Mycena pura]|uniref:Uncharacterized protein n=1 Tax=Mycena pura TaxID=153505 RepID=A0AAD6YUI2_9AGAR|nr:hypothetical protein GGX14DRAFT_553283 [Mycena pura]
MARIFVAFITFVFLLQSLAVPLDAYVGRAAADPFVGCSKTFDVSVSTGIQAARDSLGPINTANDIANARLLLQAQLSLLDANDATTQIADSLLANAPPAPDDAQARIVAGLQAAQDQLSRTFILGNNITAGAVQAANASIASALVAAENDLKNCTGGAA